MIPGSQTGRWLIYLLSAVAVVAAHQLALVAIAGQALGLMLARYPIRRWLPAFGAVGLGSMPLLFAIRT